MLLMIITTALQAYIYIYIYVKAEAEWLFLEGCLGVCPRIDNSSCWRFKAKVNQLGNQQRVFSFQGAVYGQFP
jgi:hypothetical protein